MCFFAERTISAQRPADHRFPVTFHALDWLQQPTQCSLTGPVRVPNRWGQYTALAMHPGKWGHSSLITKINVMGGNYFQRIDFRSVNDESCSPQVSSCMRELAVEGFLYSRSRYTYCRARPKASMGSPGIQIYLLGAPALGCSRGLLSQLWSQPCRAVTCQDF